MLAFLESIRWSEALQCAFVLVWVASWVITIRALSGRIDLLEARLTDAQRRLDKVRRVLRINV